MKKVLSIILVALVLVSVFTISAYAEIDYDASECKYFDKIVELNNGNEPLSYEELYYHYEDENSSEPDWTLVYAHTVESTYLKKFGTVVDDVVLWTIGSGDLSLSRYLVYVTALDKFLCVESEDLEQIIEVCPDFVDVIKENNFGQRFGDVNDDDAVNIFDVTAIQRKNAGFFESFDEVYGDGIYTVTVTMGSVYEWSVQRIADVDRDGDATILDATAIQRKLAKLDIEPEPEPEEEEKDKIVAVVRPQEIWDMPQDASPLIFENIYGEEQTYSSVYIGDKIYGRSNTYAIIKSKKQYYTMFSIDAPQFDDEFFESKYLVILFAEIDGRGGAIYPDKLARSGDTLYLKQLVFVSSSTLPPPPIVRWWVSMVAVDKAALADVTDIVLVE